jgi:chromosome segregation ATPase
VAEPRQLTQQAQALEELESLREDRRRALELLSKREQELAEIPALRERVRATETRMELQRAELLRATDELRRELEDRQEQRDHLRAELDRSRAVLQNVMQSPSWRITAPLRHAKRLLSRR